MVAEVRRVVVLVRRRAEVNSGKRSSLSCQAMLLIQLKVQRREKVVRQLLFQQPML
jgi:hypothetical protein